METSFVTCVICPRGCNVKVSWETLEDGSKNVLDVDGNSCSRGLKYAMSEVVHPERVLTSTVRVKRISDLGTVCELVPVKSALPIPKESMLVAMEEISKVELVLSNNDRQVSMGDVLINNIAGTGINMVACRDSFI